MKVKIKSFVLPKSNNVEDMAPVEAEMEDAIKSKLNDGYTFDKMVGHSSMIILVFVKDE